MQPTKDEIKACEAYLSKLEKFDEKLEELDEKISEDIRLKSQNAENLVEFGTNLELITVLIMAFIFFRGLLFDGSIGFIIALYLSSWTGGIWSKTIKETFAHPALGVITGVILLIASISTFNNFFERGYIWSLIISITFTMITIATKIYAHKNAIANSGFFK